MTSVIVRISRPNEPIVWHVVPFFARDLARLATDAHRWVGEEANLYVVLHVRVPALVRAPCAFTDHEKSNQDNRKAGSEVNVHENFP
jgi:hypothetical protein